VIVQEAGQHVAVEMDEVDAYDIEVVLTEAQLRGGKIRRKSISDDRGS